VNIVLAELFRAHPHPVTSKALIEAAWKGEKGRRVGSLQQVLSEIRDQLEFGIIRLVRQADNSTAYVIDLTELERAGLTTLKGWECPAPGRTVSMTVEEMLDQLDIRTGKGLEPGGLLAAEVSSPVEAFSDGLQMLRRNIEEHDARYRFRFSHEEIGEAALFVKAMLQRLGLLLPSGLRSLRRFAGSMAIVITDEPARRENCYVINADNDVRATQYMASRDYRFITSFQSGLAARSRVPLQENPGSGLIRSAGPASSSRLAELHQRLVDMRGLDFSGEAGQIVFGAIKVPTSTTVTVIDEARLPVEQAARGD
jgi:hypothetical protein